MINTYKIYEDLAQAMDDAAARKLASVLGVIYEDLQNTVTKVEFSELRGTVQELAEIQKRTELRVEELAEAQKRTELRVEELAEAQKRTELRVEELTEAQKRTELRVEELAEAQKRTEESVRRLADRLDDTNKQLGDTNKQMGGLAATVGYTLENEAYRHLPDLLRRDYGIEVEEPLYRDYLTDDKGRDVEVNILGRARRGDEKLLIIGESKAQLSQRDIDHFLNRRAARLDTRGRTPFPVIVAHMVSQRGAVEYGRQQGAAVYLSYQFGR
ncbi:MAG: hypothetical protein U1F70_15300 [Candidatus Competibacteraceae bacterium]